jgi:hypothetical protein
VNLKLKQLTSAFDLAYPATTMLLALAGILVDHSIANAASIGTPNFSYVSDSIAPTINLTTNGTQDWELYDSPTAVYKPATYAAKINGASIGMSPAAFAPPCTGETINRSGQIFTWSDGSPNFFDNNFNPSGGLFFSNTNTVGYYTNYQKFTFTPGDTQPHTVHLYGYVNGLSLQFSNSLAGVNPVLSTVSPSGLADFDYSVTFQANNPTDALTVVWTFQKTGASAALKYANVEAVAMTGSKPARAVNWRVIAEDTNYPTTDVLMAGVVIGDTNYYGVSLPTDTTNNDCSAYFQAAMNWLSFNGGGTVYVPPGHYMFTNGLNLSAGVTLRGRWAQPVTGQPTKGTIFDIYAGEGGTNTTPGFLDAGGYDCAVRDLAFWYPHQTNATTWTPYPWTLRGSMDVENVTFVNSYLGFGAFQNGYQFARGIYGTPLVEGIDSLWGSSIPQLEEIHFASDYWPGSGLPGAPAAAALTAAMLANTNCFGFSGTWHAVNCSFSGYCYGVLGTFDNAYGIVTTNCTEGMRQTSGSETFLANCNFAGNTYGYHRVGGQNPNCYGCTFMGGTAAFLTQGAPFGDLYLNNCTFNGSMDAANTAQSLHMNGSRFTANTAANIILESGISQVEIVSAPDANCAVANVKNNSGKSLSTFVISTNGFVPMPASGFPFETNRTRKPAKQDLFDVTSASFAGGAWGDGIHDDTAAIQAAIYSAQTNGGGIVFFPSGAYVVSTNLAVTNGVELRGVNGRREMQTQLYQSLLVVKMPSSDPNGTPFLTLGDRCGIWGMSFEYYYQYFTNGAYQPFPYLIRCAGVTNYIIGCGSGRTYQGVDMNGARGALVDYCQLGGYTNILRVRGGATDCRYQNSYSQSWGVGSMAGVPGIPDSSDGTYTAYKNADIFMVEDCTNLMLYSIYTHIAHTLVTLRNGGSVQALMLNGEQMQRGYVLESGNGALNLLHSDGNINSAGDGTGSAVFWLQTNYTGTVTDLGYEVNPQSANYSVRVDNAQAKWMGYGVEVQGGTGLVNLRAAGQVSIFGGDVAQCSLDVPGQLTVSQSVLHSMPYVSQAGTVSFSTNCLSVGNSFIAADLNDVPYVSDAITVTTNNLIPAWSDGTAWGSIPTSPVGAVSGWQLASGTNFSFHVISPYFTNGVRPNVTITMSASGIPTNGSVTVTYDTSSGMRTLSSLSATVSDARFAAPNGADIMLTASNCNPLVNYLAVYANTNLGVAPQLVNSTPHFIGTAPLVSATQLGQAGLVMSGNVGAANVGLTYWLRCSTNLGLPLSQWNWVSTNAFNLDGSFSNALPVTPGQPQLFYRLQTQ